MLFESKDFANFAPLKNMERRNLYIISDSITSSNAMSNKEHKEMVDRIIEGLKIAEQEMLKEKAKNGENVIVCESDGIIRSRPASYYLR